MNKYPMIIVSNNVLTIPKQSNTTKTLETDIL